MSYKSLKQTSVTVLDFVKRNPGVTLNAIHAGLRNQNPLPKNRITQALWALWHGRYINRRISTTEKGKNGMRVFEYLFRTDKPRSHYRRARPRPTMVVDGQVSLRRPVKKEAPAGGSDVELLVALKGGKETMVLTVEQAKDLAEQLRQLGLV